MAVSHTKIYDLAIVGGGLVGNSLACALAESGLSIAMVEAADSARSASGFDQRKLALAQRSINALSDFGVLERMLQSPTPIKRIHVSRTGDFGRVLLKAVDFGHDAFGAVVLAQDLGAALVEQVNTLKQISRYCPAKVIDYQESDEFSILRINASDVESVIQARYVVAADGTQSFIRSALCIKTIDHDYAQTLFVCSLQAENANDGTAFERFSEQGPVALLPMAEGLYGSVCGVSTTHAAEIAAMDNECYAEYIQSRFGWRAGKIKRVGPRFHYPIKRVLAERLHSKRTVLMGNAAQTIHPIGAQGFNLGLRDALCFAELIKTQGLSESITSNYAVHRAEDRERTLVLSDGMARLTANQSFSSHLMRSMALSFLASVPKAATPWVTQSMGFRSNNGVL